MTAQTQPAQPEALRLADELVRRVQETKTGLTFDGTLAYSAAELRRQHARIAGLEANGPQVERGERADGGPWFGTMRQAWEDAKQAAEVEAKEVDRLREHIRLQSIVIKQHEEATEQLCEQLAGVGVTCNQLEAELTQLRKSKPQCEWTYNDEYFHWQTSCGNAHQFGDGGIHDNKYSHCPYCGGGIGEKTP